MTETLDEVPSTSSTAPPLPVWQRVGIPIDQAKTGSQALQAAGLDWQVEQWPIAATHPETWMTLGDPDHLANVRQDTRTLLGVVGKGYRPLQNHELFEFLGTLVSERLVGFHCAAAVREGRRVFVLCSVPREYPAAEGDLVRPYLLITNTHDGSGPLQMIPATVREVCANWLNLSLPEGGLGISVRHQASLAQDLSEIRRNLRKLGERFERFEQELSALTRTSVSTRRLGGYFGSVLPANSDDREQDRDSRDRVLVRFQENFENAANTLPGVRGSAWAAFNAVSEWADHQRACRGKDQLARDEARLESIWFGAAHRLKQVAYRAALSLAGLN